MWGQRNAKTSLGLKPSSKMMVAQSVQGWGAGFAVLIRLVNRQHAVPLALAVGR